MLGHDVIRRPIVTEKSSLQKESFNQYSFEVNQTANRMQIRDAVEDIFDVRVDTVRTMHIKGKVKRRGRILGKRRDWKKAIVTLMPG